MSEEQAVSLERRLNREIVASWMMERGFATGHGDTIQDLLGELGVQVSERLETRLAEALKRREVIGKLRCSNCGKGLATVSLYIQPADSIHTLCYDCTNETQAEHESIAERHTSSTFRLRSSIAHPTSKWSSSLVKSFSWMKCILKAPLSYRQISELLTQGGFCEKLDTEPDAPNQGVQFVAKRLKGSRGLGSVARS